LGLLPGAVDDRLAGEIDAEDAIEGTVWGGEPIDLFCGARIVVGDVKGE
jgi:hypothetical protein